MSAWKFKKSRKNCDFMLVKLVCFARGNGWGDINNPLDRVDTVKTDRIFYGRFDQLCIS